MPSPEVARPGDPLPAAPGSYVVVFASRGGAVAAGRRRLEVPPGLVLYVGSARGPGGLRARLGRHLEGRGRPRWHVDRLRGFCRPREAWYLVGSAVEHEWADRLAGIGRVVPGFGASDCRCPGHLFACDRLPEPERFAVP